VLNSGEQLGQHSGHAGELEEAAGGGGGAKKGTAPVRIDADLARLLAIISSAAGEDAADIERRYAEMVRQLGKEIEGPKR
jgi:hypothetical protein